MPRIALILEDPRSGAVILWPGSDDDPQTREFSSQAVVPITRASYTDKQLKSAFYSVALARIEAVANVSSVSAADE